MAPIRLRHPKGVSTLQLDLNTATVLDLQQAIFAQTEILPSNQDRKQPAVRHLSLLSMNTSLGP